MVVDVLAEAALSTMFNDFWLERDVVIECYGAGDQKVSAMAYI